MIIENYGDLQEAVIDWARRGNIDAKVPGFIRQAENQVKIDVRVPEMLQIATGTVSTPSLAVPTGYLETQTFSISEGGDQVPLAQSHWTTIRTRASSTGVPTQFAELDESIYFAPAPDGTYSYEWTYYQEFDLFTADTDTNWILTEHPELYLFWALRAFSVWAKDTEMRNEYGDEYLRVLEGVKDNLGKRKYPPGNLGISLA